MPYINPGNRQALDVIIEGLVTRLRNIECRKVDVNYAVTRVALESLKPSTGWDYTSLSDAVGALKDAAAEIERRLLGPYEDVGIRKNGDLACFNESFAHSPETHMFANLNDPDGKRRSLCDKLQEGMSEQFEKRNPDSSPYLQKLAEDAENLEGTFQRMCKERYERLRKLNDELKRVVDGDIPATACGEPGCTCPPNECKGTCKNACCETKIEETFERR